MATHPSLNKAPGEPLPMSTASTSPIPEHILAAVDQRNQNAAEEIFSQAHWIPQEGTNWSTDVTFTDAGGTREVLTANWSAGTQKQYQFAFTARLYPRRNTQWSSMTYTQNREPDVCPSIPNPVVSRACRGLTDRFRMAKLRDVPSGNPITWVLASFDDCQSLNASWTNKHRELGKGDAWHYHTGCEIAAGRSRFFRLP
jgi:hypothetical protein